jgi:hypothetical protein
VNAERYTNGRYASFTSIGGYPLIYFTADNACLCAACANGDNGSEASETHEDNQWRLVVTEVYWEGPVMQCDHCDADIESAYGDPEEVGTRHET